MIDYLKEIEVFSDLTEMELSVYEKMFRKRCYKKNHILIFENDDTEEVYFIQSGLIKIYRAHDGKEIILGIATTGEVIGGAEIISDLRYCFSSVEALTNVQLLSISKQNFLKLIDDHPCVLKKLYSILAIRQLLLNRLIRYLTFYDVKRKVANLIVDFSYNFGVDEGETVKIDLKINQSLLASMLGISRESISKTLRELQDENIIYFSGKYLHIFDKERLIILCDGAEEFQFLRKWK